MSIPIGSTFAIVHMYVVEAIEIGRIKGSQSNTYVCIFEQQKLTNKCM